MDELTAIVATLDESFADPLSTPPILATVVDVDGSSYRRPGARMLILPSPADAFGKNDAEEPRRIGMISGGCLERELCLTAKHLAQAGPRLVSFDSRESRLQPAGRFGSGCHGFIHLLLEPITGRETRVAAQLHEVARSREPHAVGMVCSSDGAMPRVGTRFGISDIDENLSISPLCTGRLSAAIFRV